MKTLETKNLEQRLMTRYFKNGSHIAFEVDLHGAMNRTIMKDQMSANPKNITLEDPGIADAIQVDNYGVITCFELKVTKADFHSGAKLSFIGNKNYYVMPESLYEQVKEEIPPNIGVLVPLYENDLKCVKPARSVDMVFNKEAVLIALVTASHNNTTLGNIMEFAPYRFKVAERREKPNTPTFNKNKHKFAKLEDGSIEPLYYKDGRKRNFYKDEDGYWCMDFDRRIEYMRGAAILSLSMKIVEFLRKM